MALIDGLILGIYFCVVLDAGVAGRWYTRTSSVRDPLARGSGAPYKAGIGHRPPQPSCHGEYNRRVDE